jgi:hypothetical protein
MYCSRNLLTGGGVNGEREGGGQDGGKKVPRGGRRLIGCVVALCGRAQNREGDWAPVGWGGGRVSRCVK